MAALNTKSQVSIGSKLLSVVVVIISIGLALIAWSSSLRIALEIAIRYSFVVPDIDTVRRAGIVRTARIVFTVCGGGLWLIVALVSFGYHSENLGKRRSWKILAWTIGVELAIIGIDLLMQL